jgi:hypothetical protein
MILHEANHMAAHFELIEVAPIDGRALGSVIKELSATSNLAPHQHGDGSGAGGNGSSKGMSAFYKVGLNFWYSYFFGSPNSNTEDQNQFF